jgi:glutamine synthetase
MVREGVLPALSKQIRLESEAFSSVPEDIGTDTSQWKEHIRRLVRLKTDILVMVEHLSSMRDGDQNLSLTEQSDDLTARALPVMEELRRLCQEAETAISSEFWPFPRYQELLNIS